MVAGCCTRSFGRLPKNADRSTRIAARVGNCAAFLFILDGIWQFFPAPAWPDAPLLSPHSCLALVRFLCSTCHKRRAVTPHAHVGSATRRGSSAQLILILAGTSCDRV